MFSFKYTILSIFFSTFYTCTYVCVAKGTTNFHFVEHLSVVQGKIEELISMDY